MRQSRFSIALALCCSLLLAVPRIVIQATAAAFSFIVSLMPASHDELAFALGHYGPEVKFAGDCPVDAFTSNALRHEAGMRRLT